jgi:hypothetical protein
VSPSLGVDVIPISVADAAEIERSIATFADSPNGGLILTAFALSIKHRDLVIALAARYKLPVVYWDREAVVGGGLMAYGPDVLDQYGRAAGYVDRVLKGEKPADLPVQAPTKYELTINLKTAKAAWPRCAACAACKRRRGDRITLDIAAVHESLVGTFRTCRSSRTRSAQGGKAEVRLRGRQGSF